MTRHCTIAELSSPTLATPPAPCDTAEGGVVDVIYRFRWVPIALLAIVSIAPNFGWTL